jgi:pimeloyl-ACP methyl ester carboxylesterase
LVFLHGWAGSWRYWIPSMQAVSHLFRTYAIDLWGFGDTARVPNRYSLAKQVNLLDGFLKEIGIAKTALVGHGLGAIVVMMYAAQNPDWVDRLMAIGFPVENDWSKARPEALTPTGLASWLLNGSPAHETARGEAVKADLRAIQFSLEQLKDLDILDLSRSVRAACLWVYGQNDPTIDLDLAKNSTIMPEHVHQIIFDGSGHFPMLDEPSKFNRLMADFLALSSGESPENLQLKEEWKRRIR